MSPFPTSTLTSADLASVTQFLQDAELNAQGLMRCDDRSNENIETPAFADYDGDGMIDAYCNGLYHHESSDSSTISHFADANTSWFSGDWPRYSRGFWGG